MRWSVMLPAMARVVVTRLELIRLPMMSALHSHQRHYASDPTTPAAAAKALEKKMATSKTKKKSSNLTKAHLRNIENRMLFGDLLETKKERDKSIKTGVTFVKSTDNSGSNVKLKMAESAGYAKTFLQTQKWLKSQSTKKVPPKQTNNAACMGTSNAPVADKKKRIKKESVVSPQPVASMEPFPIFSSAPMSLPFVRSAQGRARLPSVTRILGDTMPPEQKEILEKWEKKMRLELGDDGFVRYKEGILANGRDLHANIRDILSGTPEDQLIIPTGIEGHWRSLRSVLIDMKQVHVLESHVTHPTLEYCGIIDCIAHYRDKLVLVDWKTSEKPKPVVTMTYDTPLQIAAYIGAINEDPNYSIKIREGLIVVAYKNGNICETFLLTANDVTIAWDKWTKRLNQYRQQQEKSTDSTNTGSRN